MGPVRCICFLLVIVLFNSCERIRNELKIRTWKKRTEQATSYPKKIQKRIDEGGYYKGRSGDVIYEALFDKKPDCVEVIHWQDQMVPILDTRIMLHFKTCPEEMQRIISLHEYQVRKENPNYIYYQQLGNKWLNLESLGDSVLTYNYSLGNGNGQYIYVNTEMTEGFCIDIFD